MFGPQCIGRLSPLPCLITWQLHVCNISQGEGLIFCISATPIWEPPSHYSMPSTLQWWKGIFKLGDGGAALEYVMCKYELLIKIACWERYIQWFLGIICTLCTPAAVSAQYSAGNIVKPHYSRSILTGIQTVHLNSISGQRVDFMFFWINWIRIIAFRENNQID